MNCLRAHGIIHDRELFKNPNQGEWCYEQQYLGYNYRMTNMQAAVGLAQLENEVSFIGKSITWNPG